MERMVRDVFATTLDASLPDPFPRLSYTDAMARYGSDKPDLRIPLELVSVDDLVAGVEFKVFAGPAAAEDGRVAALRVPGGAALSRKQIDDYTAFVARFGAKGLAYIKVTDDGPSAPILKFLPADVVSAMLTRTGAVAGDIVFFGADSARV